MKFKQSHYSIFLALGFLILGLSFSMDAQEPLSADSLQGKNPNLIIDSLDVKEMDVVDILALIENKTGMAIVGKEKVSGKLSLFLKNIKALDVVRIILDAQNLAYSQEGTMVKILAKDEFQAQYGRAFGEDVQTRIVKLRFSSYQDIVPVLEQLKGSEGRIIINEDDNNGLVLIDQPENIERMADLIQQLDVPLITENFKFHYSRAPDIASHFQDQLTKNVGKLKIDAEANSLIVTDVPSKIEEFKKLKEQLDQKEKDILLDIKALQIILDDEYEAGVDWEAIVSDYQRLKYHSQEGDLAIPTKKDELSFGTLTEEDFQVLKEALETVGDINTILSSRVNSFSEQQAAVPVNVLKTYDSSRKVTPKVNEANPDIKFWLTPVKTEEGLISIGMEPVLDKPGYQGGAREFLEPSIVVNVKPGDTIVIGGIFRDVVVESTRKLPLLGDLPLVGFVFRHQGRRVKNSEVIVFVTPKLIENKFPANE